MNLVGIALIGCFIYFMEYKPKKKSLAVALVVIVVAMCLSRVVEGAPPPARCDPTSSPPGRCPDGSPCPQCGKPSCECQGEIDTCDDKLNELCGSVQDNKGECDQCVGSHQAVLRAAGCTDTDINKYCDVGPQGPGNLQFTNSTKYDMVIIFPASRGNDTTTMFHSDEAMDAKITQLWTPMIDDKIAPLYPIGPSQNPVIQGWTAYQELRKGDGQWKFIDGTIVIPYFVVPSDKTLTWIFNPDPENPLPIWFSGAAGVFSNVDFPIKPSIKTARINYTGNTLMEWTYPGQGSGNLSIDISGAAGVNADITVRTVNINGALNKCNNPNPESPSGCDVLAHNNGTCPSIPGKWESEKTNLSTKLKYCAPPGMTDDLPLNTEIVNATPGQCGPENNCAECATGEDLCKSNPSYPKVPATELCYAKNYSSRFGCNQWWDNKKNEPAIAWKEWFSNSKSYGGVLGSGGGCNSYSWPYGEMEIQNPPSDGHVLAGFPDFTTTSWPSSNEFSCATSGESLPGGSCDNKLVQVDSSGSTHKSPLLDCQTYPADAIIVFNVQYIKTTSPV